MPLVKQNVMKFEVFILGGRVIRGEIRDGGEGVERGLSGSRIEIERKESKGN